jgi:hypothetical protein
MSRCGWSLVERQFIMSTSQNRTTSPSNNSCNDTRSIQAPPEPESGNRSEIIMLISCQWKKNIPARVLLISGCTTPIASQKWIEEHHVPFVTHKKQKAIHNCAGNTVEDCRWCYTYPNTCQQSDHYCNKTFEIGPMEDFYDLMLPCW